jgi:dGTPase
MDELMQGHGGFEHNAQTLRILELLEERYPGFPGLNLTWEVREGVIKHQQDSDARAPAEYAPGQAPTLEAQLTDFVDEIAYNNHDIDDGLASGMFTADDIRSVALFRAAHDQALAMGIDDRLVRHQVVRRIINRCMRDLLETTRGQLGGGARRVGGGRPGRGPPPGGLLPEMAAGCGS